MAATTRHAAAFERALIAAGFAVLFFLLPHALKGDDWDRLNNVQQLVRDGHLTRSKFSDVQALLSAPFERIDEAFGSLDYLIARYNVVVVAVGTLVAFRILRGRVEEALLRRVVLVLLFASMATNLLRGYGAEVTTSVLVAVGMLGVVYGRRPSLGWAAIVVGVVNTPGAIGGLALAALTEAARVRRLRLVLPVAAAVALVGAEAWIRRGSPFDTGYGGDVGAPTVLPYSGRPEFSYPIVLGVLSILFSFGRGLAFYAPGLLFFLTAETRRVVPGRRLVVLLLAFLAGLVLLYAKWWAWYGGISWGPRFFVFAAIPASLVLAARLRRAGESAVADAGTLAVLLLSGWVSFTGATVDLYRLYLVCTKSLEALCWYVPDFSSLWQPVLGFPPLPPRVAAYSAFAAAVVAYLAAPLVASVVRSLAARRHVLAWTRGWRL